MNPQNNKFKSTLGFVLQVVEKLGTKEQELAKYLLKQEEANK